MDTEEIPEWEYWKEPFHWKGPNLYVIGDRHLSNGRRQHLVREMSGPYKEYGNADIFYSKEKQDE